MIRKAVTFVGLLLSSLCIGQYPHSNTPLPGAVGHSPTDDRVCVCEHEDKPEDCPTQTSRTACERIRECKWVPGIFSSTCDNRYHLFCKNLEQAAASRAQCASFHIQPITAPVIACAAPRTHYRYYFEGPGPSPAEFIETVKGVIRQTGNRPCQFDFTHGGSFTFRDLDLVESYIRLWILPLLKDGQTAVIRGSQASTFGNTELTRAPWYAFSIRKGENSIVHHATSCSTESISRCNIQWANESFRCENGGAAIETRTCCCQANRCEFRHGSSCQAPVPTPAPAVVPLEGLPTPGQYPGLPPSYGG